MAADAGDVVAVVLAAGASSRFGSPKALATLGGRPLLQHVLDTLAAAGLSRVVVVLGTAASAVEEAVSWRAERRVRNPHPEAGLASSLQVGLAALPAGTQAALVVLGDQPMLRAEVIHAVLAAGISGGRPITVPRYQAGGALNPVLLAQPAWALAAALDGDRGMGPLIHASPDLVTNVPVAGDNPDVDTPADLARLEAATLPGGGPGASQSPADLAEAWAGRVRANRSQVDRFREVSDGQDFYRPTSSLFRADPFRTGDEVLATLLALARPGETWLDIGAGAGRYALPLARRVREVIAIDPSAAMLNGLRDGMREHGIPNVRVVDGRWPADSDDLLADVALIAHVGYDVEEIAPFLAAVEHAARRRCVAVLMSQAPAAAASPFWPDVHGESRVALPALDDLLALLRAQRRSPRVHQIAGQARRWATDEEALGFLRQQLWVNPGGTKDGRLVSMVRALPHGEDGSIEIGGTDRHIGVVTWKPAAVVRRNVH